MASNGAQAAFPPEQVLEAMLTMRSNDVDRKKKAHKFLEEFQKSVCSMPRITKAIDHNTDTAT